MNYHLMIDEKFIDGFIADAERAAPGNNVYLVSLYTPKPKFTHSPLIQYVHSVKKHWFSHIASRLKKEDKVFIHWLDRRLYDIILSLPKEIEVGIFSWMGDVIATPSYLFEKDILKPRSYTFFKKHKKHAFEKDTHHGFVYNLLLYGRHLYRRLNASSEWTKKKKVVARITYFFHWNPFDYQWIKEHYPNFSAQPVYFFYDVGIDENRHEPQNNPNKYKLTFWLGNSATISNNHFEAFDDLAHLKDDAIEIICPLSYGERHDSLYTRSVVEEGTRRFGDKFTPLLTYLERDAYYELFNRVDVVVMNHIRSQAAGNVFAFLERGKTLFMNEESTLYQLLASENVANVHPMCQLPKLSFSELHSMASAKPREADMSSVLRPTKKEDNLRKYLG